MPWVKLDDRFDSHRKVREAGNEAIGLYVRSLAYSAGHLTDGHVDRGWLGERAGRRGARLAQQLVDAGLWEPNGNGWVIHDYLDFNPSREQVEANRAELSEKRSAAGVKGAAARWRKAS